MNPTLESINYKHVAKVSAETYVNPAATASSTITFTGVANGSTSVKVGDVIYFVAVKEEGIVCDHASTVVVDTKEPTCAEEGYTGDEVCINCGEVVAKGEAIKTLEHQTEVQGAAEATCTEDGYTGDKVCTACGQTIEKGEVIKAAGHKTEVRGAAKATCTEDGYTGDEICTVCDEVVRKGEVIAAQGHNYVNGTCTNCGQDDPDLNRTYALRYITVGEQTGWYYANVKGEVDRSYTGVTANE